MSAVIPESIANWLSNRRWRDHFKPGDLPDDEPLPPITDLRLRPDGPSLTIRAEVQGSRRQPYRFKITVTDRGGRITFDCEGGSAAERMDGYMAALFEFVSRSRSAAPAPKAAETLPPAASEWLKHIEHDQRKTAGPKTKARNFLAYCLEPAPAFLDTGHPVIELRKASETARGLRIDDTRPRADALSPPSYISADDIPLVAIYQALNRNPRVGCVPSGRGWTRLIESALAMGRLFWSPDARKYTRLESGPPVRVEPAWQDTPDGKVRPTLKFDGDAELVFLPTEPPHYLDPAKALVGPLESGIPGRVLARWQGGPVLVPDSVGSLAKAVTARGLPAPTSRPTRTLLPANPRPHLRITLSEIGPPLFRLPSIVAEPRFSYHDSPPLKPAALDKSSTATWFTGDTRFTTTRNLNAEKKWIRRLGALDLLPASELTYGGGVFHNAKAPADDAWKFVLPDIFEDEHLEWLEWLEDHTDILRAEGWQIDIDPATGLVVHKFDDLFPEIERESEHGIDWFRFDLTGEIDGKRVSLLPYIAEALRADLPAPDDPDLPEFLAIEGEGPTDPTVRFPTRRFLGICHQIAHLFQGDPVDGPRRLDRITAAGLARSLEIDGSQTARALAEFGRKLADIRGLPAHEAPSGLHAELRPYQLEGYRWLRFLAENGLHGILADDMGLGKTVQTLAFLAAHRPDPAEPKPSLVVAPTSVITNWAAEAARFTPGLRTLLLHGPDRADHFPSIPDADLVLTSYPLLVRDHAILEARPWHTVVLDEAQAIKNPRTAVARHACALDADHRFCLSGTPMENHLGELWSIMRFLMPGHLGDADSFRENFRRPIERDRSPRAQLALNRRVGPLVLRRTKDQVASELPPKTEVVHHLDLSTREADLYESVRALMDKRVRDAINERGMGKSHIIALDALLKLRQICCHPTLLKDSETTGITHATKLDFLTTDLLPTLIDEGRRILLFSQFTSMLAIIQRHLEKKRVPFLKLTGSTTNRAALVEEFQRGGTPVFLISLKAGGTGLNLTAADTVIHYDPWWNPAAENQATDRAHRIGQDKPVFVHKLICRGTIEDRILDLQAHKSSLVEALLSEETSGLRLDPETLSHLLAPLA